jgi:N-acetylmuramoyl-L-alanine amidase
VIVMPIEHIARRGESIESIAYQYGMFWETVWSDAGNEGLRALRREPNILVAGDVVVVPDKREGSATRGTGARHVFRRRGVPSILRVQLLDANKPRAGLAYTVTANGRTWTGATDAQGWVECWLMPDVRRGNLRLDATGEVFVFDMGGVGPPETPRGIQTRLRNLGHYVGSIDDTLGPEAAAALAAFQAANGLPDTGEPDDATVEALRKAHGS